MVQRLLHVANNTLSVPYYWSLQSLGGPGIPSIVPLCRGAMVRCATSLRESWLPLISLLTDVEDARPLSALISRSRRAMDWDTEPLIFNLQEAYVKWWSTEHTRRWEQMLNLDPRSSLQKFVVIESTVFKTVDDWAGLLLCKGKKLGINYDLQDWTSATRILQSKRRGYLTMSFLKTILNSWTTSSRFHHGDGLSCILGCESEDAEDSVRHYLSCPVFRDCVGSAFSCEMSSDASFFGPQGNVTVNHIMHVAAAFVAYHDVKRGHFDIIWQASMSASYTQVRTTLTECLSAARSELAK